MTDFLRDYQMEAVNKMKNGCILNGGTGSGKSRTGLYYYFKENGGSFVNQEFVPMKNPQDLYIITTAMKRDSHEWDFELANYRMSVHPDKNELYPRQIVVIDSWNNIKKYGEIQRGFFIFDEDRVTGSGAWVKAFQKIAKNNNWIILSATPGDCWADYIPVFVANGFYKNKTEFCREHVVYSRFTKYPQIDRYLNTGRLLRLRNNILVDMDFSRHTVHDAAGNLIGMTDALGQAVGLEYDKNGRVTTAIQKNGGVLATVYDKAGRVISETDANKHTTRYRYGKTGLVSEITDALGQKALFEYDALGNVTKITAPGNAVTQ